MEQNTEVLVIAHRGFRGIAPENTLIAAKKGHDARAQYWELDVAASSDGTLVVLHDDTLTRTTDAAAKFPARSPWSVYSFTLAELKSLDAGSWFAKSDPFGTVASGKVPRTELDAYKGIRLPTLEEALLLTRELGWKVNIEIKDATGEACDPWIVEKTAKLVQSLDMAPSVIVSSFNHAYLERLRACAPEIARAALIDRPVADPVGLLTRLDAVALNPNGRYLDESTVRAVRAAGFGVLVWTANDQDAMARFVRWGVTGLITDFPDRAFEVLENRGG